MNSSAYQFVSVGDLRVGDHICSGLGPSMHVTSAPLLSSTGFYVVDCALRVVLDPGEVLRISKASHSPVAFGLADVEVEF